MLTEVFAFHPIAVHECVVRNQVPKVHAYADHVFVVLHAPELGEAGVRWDRRSRLETGLPPVPAE